MPDFTSFQDFYEAVHGWAPFPWQNRLAERVATDGWPREIGVPTGMGKTACIDIAVWELARQAATRTASTRTAPTRIWYVVNRRLLVSAALDLGRRLQAALRHPELNRSGSGASAPRHRDALVQVAAALKGQLGVARSAPGDPLAVVQLRGGAVSAEEGGDSGDGAFHLSPQPPDPSHAALLVSTVPMYASRLLFRGYGLSPSIRPIEAAAAGTDCLVLLDEAHLSRPLLRVQETAAQCDVGTPDVGLPQVRQRPRLVSLTATGEDRGDRFDLDGSDLANDTIARRLHATKPTSLVETNSRQLAATLAAEATGLARRRPGSCTVVFCNTVQTARETHTLLCREWREPDEVLLATGRVRPREATIAVKTLMDPADGAPSGRDLAPAQRSLLVVATQTLEVGADLDFDFLVTESASARAITQRYGRLNRLGDRPHARASICHAGDGSEHPPYGGEPNRVWERLHEHPSLNLEPASIAGLLGEPQDQGARAGELLPAHLWELAKTRSAEHGEPPVELFFDELDDRNWEVSVAWRAVLPETPGGDLVPLLREAECVDVPLVTLRAALKDATTVWRVGSDRTTVEQIETTAIRPGDQVVLGVEAGRYDRYGWNDRAREIVSDLSPLLDGIVWLDRPTVNGLVAFDPDDEADADRVLPALRERDETAPHSTAASGDELDPESARLRLIDMLRRGTPRWATPSEWTSYVNEIAMAPRLIPGRSSPGDAAREYLRAPRTSSRAWQGTLVVDDLDELSGLAPESKTLADHCEAVAGYAGQIAARVGLDDRLVEVLRLAGRYHDVGKTDERFQRWLDPDGRSPEPVAKSQVPREQWAARRAQSGWPRGGRHELLSARLLVQWAKDVPVPDLDLLLHLILSHHGHGRPWSRAVPDPGPGPVSAAIEGRTVEASADLSWIDWDQPARFRRLCECYGYWGLGLLESILRKADTLASGAAEVV